MSFGTEFLNCPELFPARRAGEPWGDHHVTIDFLGGPYLFSGLHQTQVEAVRNHFGPYYLKDDASPCGSVEIRLYRAGESDFREFQLKGWEYHLDFDYHSHSVRVAGLKFMGLLEWHQDLAGAVWTSALDPDRFCEVFENFLRATTQYHVLGLGGLLVHSAALVIDDAAYLFPGRSGAGKSTLSRLAAARHWQILSDELNALSVREAITYVQQVPFAGDFGRTSRSDTSFPLAGIFSLRQAGGGRHRAPFNLPGARRDVVLLSVRKPRSTSKRARPVGIGGNRLPTARPHPELLARRKVGRTGSLHFQGTGSHGMSFALRRDVRYRLLLNEAVVIRQDAAEVLGLNLVGARVLELIDDGLAESEILERLVQEFDVAPKELHSDVQAFIAELIELDVVESLPAGN